MGTSTLHAYLPSTCSIGLLDRFPCCCIGEFIRFSICSTKAKTLPSYATFAALDPEFGDSAVVLLLNFGGIFLANCVCPTVEYAQLIIQNKKIYRCSTKMCPTGCTKNYVFAGFWSRTYKTTRIGECVMSPKTH